jgi:hypothetical protein
LVLVDGSSDGLDKTKEMLQGSSTEIKVVQFDYEKSDDWTHYEALCQKIQEEVGGKDNISMLINNIEERDPMGERFHEATDKQLI